jgi:hypothetical protein
MSIVGFCVFQKRFECGTPCTPLKKHAGHHTLKRCGCNDCRTIPCTRTSALFHLSAITSRSPPSCSCQRRNWQQQRRWRPLRAAPKHGGHQGGGPQEGAATGCLRQGKGRGLSSWQAEGSSRAWRGACTAGACAALCLAPVHHPWLALQGTMVTGWKSAPAAPTRVA